VPKLLTVHAAASGVSAQFAIFLEDKWCLA